MNKVKKEFVWYCLASPSFKGRPRFDTIEETIADILREKGCGPCCEDELAIFDLQKNKVVKMFNITHNLETGEIEKIWEI